jgi:hypothetical protein
MTDRELLELAAKAAGLKLAMYQSPDKDAPLWLAREHANPVTYSRDWNPLTDDGDALRLAVKLNIQVTPGTYNKEEYGAFKAAGGEAYEHPHYGQDEYASTRRAIVRAAAAIGEQA